MYVEGLSVKNILLIGFFLVSSTTYAVGLNCSVPAGCSFGETSYGPICTNTEIRCPFDTNNEDLTIVGHCGECHIDQTPKKISDSSDAPANQCGSIINVDTLSVGETLPVVGTNESLTYFSDRVIGRTGDYTFSLPLLATPLDPDIENVHVSLKILGTTRNYDYMPQEGLNFEFTWDGKDESGHIIEGATEVEVTVSQRFTSGRFDLPLVYKFKLGAWKAKLVGLGGWTLSSHHFYDTVSKKIYLGSGSIRTANGILVQIDNNSISTQNINLANGYMIAAADESEVYIFDTTGRHLQTRSARTGAILKNFQYNLNGTLKSITNNFGDVITIANASASQVTITSPRGQITRLYLNSNGYASQIRDPQGRRALMTYVNQDGLLQSFQKPSGTISTFSYNSLGQLSRDESSAGSFFNFLINAESSGYKQIIMSSAENRKTIYNISLQTSSFSRTEIKPTGAVYSISYSPSTYTYITTDAGSNIAQDYSPSARFQTTAPQLRSLQITSGNQSAQFYNNINSSFSSSDILNLESETQTQSINGNVWQKLYNGTEQKWTYQSPLNRTQSLTYNSFDQIIESQLNNYQPTQYSYDAKGKLIRIEQGPRISEMTYDNLDRVSHYKNALNETSQFTYDANGRVLSKILADGRVFRYSYDVNGNLSGVKPSGQPWHYFTSNAFDLIASYIAPLVDIATQTTYEYNLDKQMTKITKPDGTIVQFNYGSTTSLLNSIQTPEGLYTRQYTNLGLPSNIQSPQGVVSEMTYNGELIASFKNTFSGVFAQINYTYENFLVKKLQFVTTASPSADFTIDYDADMLPVRVGDLVITREAQTGKVANTQIGFIQEQYQYDPIFGEPSNYKAFFKTTLLLEESYSRDLLGRISQKSVTTTEGTHIFGYIYDSTGRLIQVNKDGNLLRSYKYDTNSNRLWVEENGRRVRGTYDDQDRMLTYGARKYSYTASGDRLQRYVETNPRKVEYEYNSLGALSKAVRTAYDATTQVSTVDTFEYLNDGLGRRLEKRKNGLLKERYMYDDSGRLIAELDANGKIISYFIYATRSYVPDYMVRAKAKFKLIHDHLGSVRMVVNIATGDVQSKMEYDEFGRFEVPPTAVAFQPFGFAGGIYDSTIGLVRFGARDYDPLVGRWTSKDPILFEGGDSNLYGYVLQDPVNLIDPSGLLFEDQIGSVTTPAQQAGIGAGLLTGGIAAIRGGILTLNPALTIGGGLAAYEGVRNIQRARDRGFPDFNPFEGVQNPPKQNNMCSR